METKGILLSCASEGLELCLFLGTDDGEDREKHVLLPPQAVEQADLGFGCKIGALVWIKSFPFLFMGI